jgi:hypothetical protein
MARSNATDPLSVYPFWLMDLGPTDSWNFPIFTPLFGFQSITSPEMTAETMDITECNWIYTRKVLKRATVSNITLTRGVMFYDSDFYRWMISGLVGSTAGQNLPLAGIPFPPGIMEIGGPTYRRNMLLIQYFSKVMFPGPAWAGALAQSGVTTLLGGLAATASGLEVSTTSLLTTAGSLALASAGVGTFEMAARVPARAWMLIDCIPVRYKAGSDFDAGSSAVSVMEVELGMERWEEIALSA